ncbi:hypothetical protein O3M35_007289 [Rhynocoris fuscipes]|uniref:TLC domain-containing protein n=1 Tax=Rhynocoris fuscipes TaxID=488301 RepID=A0AAW1D9K4_9HEMI
MFGITDFIPVTSITSFSSFCWFSFYIKIKNNYDTEPEFSARIVAAVHAIIVVLLSYLSLTLGPNPLYDPGKSNTIFQTVTMFVSIGYFVYDFLWCIKYQPEPKIMLIHHLASIMAILYILFIGRSGAEAIGGLGSLELTNPLLQARWFLRTYNMKSTKLYMFVEYTFVALFLIVRLGYGSLLLVSVVRSDKTSIVVKLLTIVLYLISLAFIYSIARFVLKKYTRPTRRSPTADECDEEEDDDDDGDVKLS